MKEVLWTLPSSYKDWMTLLAMIRYVRFFYWNVSPMVIFQVVYIAFVTVDASTCHRPESSLTELSLKIFGWYLHTMFGDNMRERVNIWYVRGQWIYLIDAQEICLKKHYIFLKFYIGNLYSYFSCSKHFYSRNVC